MSGYKFNISLIIVLVSLFSFQAFSQKINNSDSLAEYNSSRIILKPALHYSVGSTFTVIPHLGSVTGFTISPSLSVALSPKLSFEGGIIAGRFYSTFSDFNLEREISGSFSELDIYGTARYHVSSKLTLYGTGIKQLTSTSPFFSLPKSSYSIGSDYKFGNFSVGLSLHISKWNNNLSPMSLSDHQGFFPPFNQGSGPFTLFGR
jgi:hypothetical protein